MIQALAVAVAVVLAHALLAGTALDVDPLAGHFAPAVLALAAGVGLLRRARLHPLAYGLLFAVLVPLRPTLVDAARAALPAGPAADGTALVFSLGPLGFVLGRLLTYLVQGGVTTALLGWVLGELLVRAGAVGWLPGVLTGFLGAGLLAGLVELGRQRRQHRDAGSFEPGAAWEALPVGLVLAAAWVGLRRVAPSYAGPPVGASSEVSLALLAPAVVVAWPTAVLAGGKAETRRLLLALGFLALAYALWKLAIGLGLYQHNIQLVDLSNQLRQRATRHGPPVTEWRAWLTVFCGFTAAAAGLALGSLRRPAIGPLLLGVAAGLLAEMWVVRQPDLGPQQLLVSAAGCAVVATLGTWNRWALLLLPAGVLAWTALPDEERAAYEAVRRVGEPAVEAFGRSLSADVQVFSSFGPSTTHPAGRRAYALTMTDRAPLLERRILDGEDLSAHGHGHGHGDHDHEDEDEGPAPPPLLAAPEDDDADLVDALPRHFGVRLGGVAYSPGDDPFGVEGSTGRLVRLLGRRGPAFVTGLGAEILAADLLDADLSDEVVVASPLPFGERNQRVFLVQQGSKGVGLRVDPAPLARARALFRASCSTVVVAPEPVAAPAGGAALGLENLEELAELLRPGGRCLAWIDTAELGARPLRARVAAFASVFGERSLALVEMRGQRAPLVLLVGWRDDAGRPTAEELTEQLPWPDVTGRRSRLASLDDLGAMLLRAGPGMQAAADDWPRHRRRGPVPAAGLEPGGWAAVVSLVDDDASLAQVLGEGPGASPAWAPLAAGLHAHTGYRYEPDPAASAMLTEIVADVDWDAFDAEVAHYVEAARLDPQNPLLHMTLASLLVPLARVGDFGRFARVFEGVGAEAMDSWRLAALHSFVLEASLQEDAAHEALERARALARWSPPDEASDEVPGG